MRWAVAVGLTALACDGQPAPAPTPRADAVVIDAAIEGPRPDAAPALDRGVDASPADAAPQDATGGAPDRSVPDLQPPDAARPDAQTPDVGAPDAAAPDAQTPDVGAPDALPPDLCARQPDFDACVAVGCRWSAEGECRFVEQAEPPCHALDEVLCDERLDCAPLGDLCQRTLEAPCVVLDAGRCSLRPEACRWARGRCVPAGGVDPCAAVPFPACPEAAGCDWLPEPCVGDCPELPQAQPWPSGQCRDGDLGPCAALDEQGCGAAPECRFDPGLGRCLTLAQRCGQLDDLSCFEQGCFMVRYRLCDPLTRPDGSPDPDECDWREVFVCEDV